MLSSSSSMISSNANAASTSTSTPIPCYSGIASFGVCSSGFCNLTTGSCVCNAGYFGAADFVTMDRTAAPGGVVLDCPSSEAALRVLHCVALVPTLFAAVQFYLSMRDQWPAYVRKRDRGGNNVRHWYQYTSLYIMAGHLLPVAASTAYLVLRIASPVSVIMVSPAATVLHCMRSMLFYFWGSQSQYEMTRVGLMEAFFGKSEVQVAAFMRPIHVEYSVLYSVFIFSNLLMLPPLFLPPPDRGGPDVLGLNERLFLAYYGIIVIACIAQFIFARRMIRRLRKLGSRLERFRPAMDAGIRHQQEVCCEMGGRRSGSVQAHGRAWRHSCVGRMFK